MSAEPDHPATIVGPLVGVGILVLVLMATSTMPGSSGSAPAQANANPAPSAAPAPRPAPAAGIAARHVLVMHTGSMRAPATITRTREEAQARINEVLQKARGGEDFAALAREYSDGPSGPRGGDLGTFRPGMMVAPFDRAAFALDVDGVSDVVETPFGYHVIQRYR